MQTKVGQAMKNAAYMKLKSARAVYKTIMLKKHNI